MMNDEEEEEDGIDSTDVKETAPSTTPLPSRDHDHHVAQWERQGVWLTRLRGQKIELEKQGIKGFDLLEAMATFSINHKLSLLEDHRCHRCWHDKSQNHCICDGLKPLVPEGSTLSLLLPHNYSNNNNNSIVTIRLCILMHHKEYYCAGNSAKLLLCLLPNHTELYLFGKQGEVDRLLQDISSSPRSNSRSNMILWPGENAISVSEFLEDMQQYKKEENNVGGGTEDTEDDSGNGNPSEPLLMNAIVLDGTYTQARNMNKSLRKRWGKERMPISVALRPSTSSVFHRAQKNYGKAHTQGQGQDQQTQQGGREKVLRVSTAEACGLLLTEMGANKKIQESITEAVLLNNRALDYARKSFTGDG